VFDNEVRVILDGSLQQQEYVGVSPSGGTQNFRHLPKVCLARLAVTFLSEAMQGKASVLADKRLPNH
jgi:hypothetical protein